MVKHVHGSETWNVPKTEMEKRIQESAYLYTCQDVERNYVLMPRIMNLFSCPCICVSMHLHTHVHVYSRNQLCVYRDCLEPCVDFHATFAN